MPTTAQLTEVSSERTTHIQRSEKGKIINHIVLLPPRNYLFFLGLTFKVEKIEGLCQGMEF